MPLKPTRSTILLLGGLTGVTLLGFAGVGWGLTRASASAAATLQTRQAELNDGERIARRREAARAALEADRAQLRFLETAVSDAAYVPTLLKQLEELAIRTQNRVLSVRPIVEGDSGPSRLQQRRDPNAEEKSDSDSGEKKEEKKAPEPYTRLGIQVTLVGTFGSTQQFVERLTRFPKIVAVEQIQLRPHAGQESSEALLDAELKLTAFVMKEGVASDARPGGSH